MNGRELVGFIMKEVISTYFLCSSEKTKDIDGLRQEIINGNFQLNEMESTNEMLKHQLEKLKLIGKEVNEKFTSEKNACLDKHHQIES